MDKCPKCNSEVAETINLITRYKCGTTEILTLPNTLVQTNICKNIIKNGKSN